MLQPHIQLDESVQATAAILPGDPARLDRIAPFLKDVKELAYNREFRSLRGTWKGFPVIAISTGIGGSSAAIAIEELHKIGVNAMKMVANKEVRLPEFSVTSNQPSVINGGKDFCEWTHKDRQMYATMRKPAEMVLGRLGKGLSEIALAESLLDKGSEDLYEIMCFI